MKFLQAKKILRESKASNSLACEVLTSVQVENLSPFLEAHLALKNICAQVAFTPFGTLRQRLLVNEKSNTALIACLYPWDYCPALDWRQYQTGTSVTLAELVEQVLAFDQLLGENVHTGVFIDAPVPPVLNANEIQVLRNLIASCAVKRGLKYLSEQSFSLAAYLEFGRPISNAMAPHVASVLSEALFKNNVVATPKKVILTDLDNTAWLGVVGEDGVAGVACAAYGPGFAHYIYQCFLKRCAESGVLLIAVSKNDIDLAKAPFEQKDLPLKLTDFVDFKVGYGHKSQLILQVSEELNLPLDSFVFIDDNPIELAEVASALPAVTGVQFPAEVDELPAVLETLQLHFNLTQGSKEDSERTELYKIRALAEQERKQAPSLHEYLASLEMELHINTQAHVDNARAIQLINKTNQFNLNGLRITEEELSKILTDGGNLFTATLVDKFGNHGEILACVVDAEGKLLRWVMSCRVLQRNVEYYFLYWLLSESGISLKVIEFVKTDRNAPLEQFLITTGLVPADSGLQVNSTLDYEGIRKALYKATKGIFKAVRVN